MFDNMYIPFHSLLAQPVFLCGRLSSCGTWNAFAFTHCFCPLVALVLMG